MDLINPSVGSVFWSTVGFLLLLFLLWKFAWKHVLKAINSRNEFIDKALKSAEKAREEITLLKTDNERIIAEAIIERAIIIKEARETKDQIISEAKNKASEEAGKMLEANRISMENEKQAAINEMKAQIARYSIEIAEKILRQKLEDDNTQKELIDQMLKELKLN